MKDLLWYLSEMLEKHEDHEVITIQKLKEIVNDIENQREKDEEVMNSMEIPHW